MPSAQWRTFAGVGAQHGLANLAKRGILKDMTRVGMHQAKTQLSKLVERAEAGEDIVIQRNGKVVARLVPVVEEPRSLASVRGAWRGRVRMADDFDELPEDIAAAFGAR